MLALPAMAQLQALPLESRVALAAVLEELAQDGHQRAEKAWRQRKGPMAAYWRAVGVYARHTARAVKRGAGAALPAEGRELVTVEADGVRLQLRELEALRHRPGGALYPAGRDPISGAWVARRRRDPLTGEWHG